MISFVDLLFQVLGSRVPTDHHYPLYASVSQTLPWLHDGETKFGLALLTGDYVGQGQLRLVADQGVDGSVVVWIGVDVQQPGMGCERRRDRVDRRTITALAEVRHALERQHALTLRPQ